MTKLWKALCITVVAVGLSAPSQAQAQDLEDLLCNLLGIGCPEECTCGDELDELQQQIEALADALGNTNAALANLQDQVNDCCGDLEELQFLVDALVEEHGGTCGLQGFPDDCDGNCTDLDTDEANCGECGNTCNPGHSCIGGACEPDECPPPVGDPDFDCNEGIRNADDSCDYIPVADGAPCDDGQFCTTVDECSGGVCLGGGDTPCGVGETCSEEGGGTCVPD